MTKRSFVVLLFPVLVVIAGTLTSRAVVDSKSLLHSIPLAFEQNLGQVTGEYQFVARRNGLETYFAKDKVGIAVAARRGGQPDRLALRFRQASDSVRIIGEDRGTGRTNYLLGQDSTKWVRNVPQFSRLRYSGLYSGIDLVFYGTDSALEHDFVVAPGAHPERIAFTIENGNHIELLPTGDIEVQVGAAAILLKKPVAYQVVAGSRKLVQVQFLKRGQEIGFEVGNYDRNLPLVIDPVLAFATYFTGATGDQINAVTSDAAGNIYITGSASVADFPGNGVVEPRNLCGPTPCSGTQAVAFVTKLDPTATNILFSTFLGVNEDSGSGPSGYSLAVDSAGNVVVAGTVTSIHFPQAGNFPSRIYSWADTSHFVVSLRSDGSAFNYAGVIAGAVTQFTQGKVTLDSNGNAYFTGQTDNVSFPITTGVLPATVLGYPYQSTFVMKLDTTGAAVYSTIIPGRAPIDPFTFYNNCFAPKDIFVDANGNASIAGTAYAGLPTTPGTLSPDLPAEGSTAFVLKLNPTASAIIFATYVPDLDLRASAMDASGNYYLTGATASTHFPVTSNAYQKTVTPSESSCWYGVVAKLDNTGAGILSASYLSGTCSLGNSGSVFSRIALDSRSNVILAGFNGSSDFPLVMPFQTDVALATLGTATGEVIAVMNSDLSSLTFATALHGSTWPYNGTYFTGVTVPPDGSPVFVGLTNAQDFPTTDAAFQRTPPPSPSRYTYGVIAKIDLAAPAPAVCLDKESVAFGTIVVNTSTTQTLTVTNCGNGPLTIQSVASSSPIMQVDQNCTNIAAGGNCTMSFVLTPTETGSIYESVTLKANTPVPTRKIYVNAQAAAPEFSSPSSVNVGDELVGTQGISQRIWIRNRGTAPLILADVSVTGDFSVRNDCTTPLAPYQYCYLWVTLTPSQIGSRSGVVTITDNAPGSPHKINLTGNGIASYAAPTISSIVAVPSTDSDGLVYVYGTNFYSASTVLWNGQPRTTKPYGSRALEIVLSPGDLSSPGEVPVIVSNPAPGGGASSPQLATIYGHLDNIMLNHMVYEPHSGLLYASVSQNSSQYPDSVVAIDPAASKVVKNIVIGGTPNQIAVSDDGTLLYVGLDGSKEVAQLSLPSGTVNFTSGLGNDRTWGNPMIANSLIVMPGKPHTWVVSKCGTGYAPCGEAIAVFNDSTELPNSYIKSQLAPDSMTFVGSDSQKLFASSLNFSPPIFYQFAINDSGISLTSELVDYSNASIGGGKLASDGTYIYVSNGQIIDPVTQKLKATIGIPAGYTVKTAMALDPGNERIYFSGLDNYGWLQLVAFDRNTQQKVAALSTVAAPELADILRWGNNGIAMQQTSSVLFLPTSLTGFSQSIEVTPASLVFGPQLLTSSSSKAITIKNTGSNTVSITGVAKNDPGADFTVTNECPSSLIAGATCTVVVGFAPQSSGNKNGNVTISHTAPGSPTTIALSGIGADFSLSAAGSTSATISAGQSATYSLQISGTPGLSSTAALSCSGAPASVFCSVSPTSVTLSGTNGVNVSVNVSTTARTTASVSFRGTHALPLWSLGLLAGAALAIVISPRDKKLWGSRCTLLLVLGFLISCGGGGGGSTPTNPPPTGTPAGTYTLTVNAKVNGITRSSALSLIVK